MSDEVSWDAESEAYIRSRSSRYQDGIDIETAWTQEVMRDADMAALEPDPKSRAGTTRFIGRASNAGRVLVLIAHRDLDGDPHGINACPATGADMQIYEEGLDDGTTIDPQLIARLREESERTKDDPYPEGIRAVRPHRSQVYAVRLSTEEQARVQIVADSKHLPASTLVRSWILDRLDQESA